MYAIFGQYMRISVKTFHACVHDNAHMDRFAVGTGLKFLQHVFYSFLLCISVVARFAGALTQAAFRWPFRTTSPPFWGHWMIWTYLGYTCFQTARCLDIDWTVCISIPSHHAKEKKTDGSSEAMASKKGSTAQFFEYCSILYWFLFVDSFYSLLLLLFLFLYVLIIAVAHGGGGGVFLLALSLVVLAIVVAVLFFLLLLPDVCAIAIDLADYLSSLQHIQYCLDIHGIQLLDFIRRRSV